VLKGARDVGVSGNPLSPVGNAVGEYVGLVGGGVGIETVQEV